MKRVNFQHVNNMRDLGGYPTLDGRYTAYSRLLRSDAPIILMNFEIEILRDMGITTVIDLRMEDECSRNPCGLRDAEGFDYHHIPMDAYAVILEKEKDMPLLYMAFAENTAVMQNIMQTIASSKGGVLFHCVAGKDRTGVVAALLLSLAGVELCDILADYQLSYTYIKKLLDEWNRDYPDWPAFISRSDPEYMAQFIAMFRSQYGSIDKYLLQTGMSAADVSKLRSKLL